MVNHVRSMYDLFTLDEISAKIAELVRPRSIEWDGPIDVIYQSVDERKVGLVIGDKIKRADAAFVREKTGFAIGGVPPVGHAERPLTVIDEDLLGFAEVWAAAGTPNAVFRLTPGDLQAMTEGRTAGVKQD